MTLKIDPEAEAETQQAAIWYDRQRTGLGLEFLATVDHALQRILRNPQQYSRLESLPNEPNVRRLVLDRFPYLIIYEVSDDEIRILAVSHARRSPGYWKRR
jgi:toxin ParE1/3/4